MVVGLSVVGCRVGASVGEAVGRRVGDFEVGERLAATVPFGTTVGVLVETEEPPGDGVGGTDDVGITVGEAEYKVGTLVGANVVAKHTRKGMLFFSAVMKAERNNASMKKLMRSQSIVSTCRDRVGPILSDIDFLSMRWWWCDV